MSTVAAALDTVRRYLVEQDIEHEDGARDGEVVAVLPGEHKLKTVVSLLVTESGLSASAFVIRNADENHEAFYRSLLRRNLRLPGVAYGIDEHGDVYVVAHLPLSGVDEGALDVLLGSVLVASDDAFDPLLELGFLTSMQREWDWRVSRGESLRNLEAFRHLLEHGSRRTGDDTSGGASSGVDQPGEG